MLARICAFITALVLAACGGGGGDAGTPSLGGGGAAALFTSAAATVNLEVGRAGEYSISGGKAPYTVSSSDLAVASVGLQGTAGFVISGVKGGSATVTVKDAAGSAVSIAVTVGSNTPLFSSAPAAVSLVVGSSQSYQISGGAAPYAVSSADVSVASAMLATSGSGFTVTAAKVGTTRVVVTDAKGSTVPVDVTVSAATTPIALYTTAASPVVIAVGTSPVYTVGGGTAPYAVTSSNEAVAKAVVTSQSLAVSGLSAGSAVIQVTDAVGARSSISVTVGSASVVALYTTAPPALTIAKGSAEQKFVVGGGVGPYTASSGNSSIVAARVVGSELFLTGLGSGSTGVSVFDSTGRSVPVAVTVSVQISPLLANPASTSGVVGDTLSVAVTGGTPGYTYLNVNSAVATVVANEAGFRATLLRAGQTTVVIRDSAGQALEVLLVATNPAVSLFTSAPANLTMSASSQRSFSIGGGLAPYSVQSDNNSIVEARQSSAGVLQLDAKSANGQALVTVRDSNGVSVAISVTVGNTAALFTSAPGAIAVSTGVTRTFEILGGTAPYFSRSTNEAVSTVTNVGSVLSIRGDGPGTATAVVRDSLGASVNIAVTVGSTVPLYTSAPASVRLAVGEQSAPFAIVGGASPYTVTTTNANVFSVSQPTPTTFRLLGVSPGGVTDTISAVVKDALGSTVSINVSVGPALPLFMTAPSSVLIGIGAVNAQTYQIRGGTPPYLAAVTNDASTTAPVSARIGTSGDTLIVQGLAAGTAQVLLTDSLGDRVATTVSVSGSATAPLAVSPAAVTGAVGDSLNFVIQGGTPGAGGYTASVVNQNVASALSTGANSFRVNLTRVGQTDITVVDSLGQVQVVTVTAQPSSSALFTSAPANVTFTNGVAQSFTVGGGTGTYSFQSSNLAVASVGAPGTTLVVTPQGVGSASVTVSDSAGAQVSFNVSVQAAVPLATSAPPAGVTLSPSATPTDYEIFGGRTGYTVSSSNQAVATVQVTGASSNVLSITPVAAGTATVVVTDAVGSRVQVPVTVSPSGVLALTVTPESAGGTVGDVLTFTVSGGTPAGGNYTVRSNNTNIATVPATASSTFSATLVNAGTTVISVFDAQGQIQNVTLNVTSAATAIRVSPSAVLVGERLDLGPNLDPNNISLSVIGGAIAGNARAFSSDLTRITPVASGRTIRLFQGIQGTLCFVPGTDTSAATVTDLPVVITVVDDQGSSATMTVTIRNESACP